VKRKSVAIDPGYFVPQAFRRVVWKNDTYSALNELDAKAASDGIGRARKCLQRDGGIAGVE
jgi:hypothetical protein